MANPRLRVLEVFNRYLFYGGEEKIADWIAEDLTRRHDLKRCSFHSREWQGGGALGKAAQVRQLFYNKSAKQRFENSLKEFEGGSPNVALFHNVYPVGSPSLYHAAHLANVPVVQYVHNFRPFSVGGTLFVNGQLMDDAIKGRMWPEVKAGAWQGSVIKSALMALVLKRLLRSGWLDQVKTWICISQFMKERFAEAGVPEDRLTVLKHPWQMSPDEFVGAKDGQGYLFLGRLVEEKGVKVLLQAWKLLETQCGDETPVLTIAGEGPLEDEVRKAASEHRSIRHVGMLSGESKKQALRECRALVAPSVWWEPLGLVVYEAYEYGKPVLAAKSGGLAETVQEGSSGFLHERSNPASLVESVRKMEQLSSIDRETMGIAARSWLQQHASVDAWRLKLDEVLQNAAQLRSQ